MPGGAVHEIAVARILAANPEAKTRRLMKAIRDAVEPWQREDFTSLAAIPDAFIVDPINRLVTLFEVEVTHPVSEYKMQLYGDLWWGIDGNDWDMLLIKVDGEGRETAVIDMGDYVTEKLVSDARKRRFG